MELLEVKFEEKCPTVNYSFQIARDKQTRFSTIIVKFTGVYREGSRGNPDADFIIGIIKTAIMLWQSSTVILDLTELAYTWGNKMFDILTSSFEWRPYAIVVGPDNRKAISTIFLGEDTEKDITDKKSPPFFNTVEEAFTYIQTLEKE